MNALSVFEYETRAVRMVMRDDEPWWVLSDVCAVLDLSNPSKAATGLDPDERMTLTSSEGQSGLTVVNNDGQGRGGARSLTLINQSGLYSLILRSRKEEAKRFKKWVTSVVLPSIRKTGSYSVRPAPVAEPATTLLERLADPEARAALEVTMRLVEFSKDLTPDQRVLAAKVGLPIDPLPEAPKVNPVEVEIMSVLAGVGSEMGYLPLKAAMRKRFLRTDNATRAALMELVRLRKVALRRYRNQELLSLVTNSQLSI